MAKIIFFIQCYPTLQMCPIWQYWNTIAPNATHKPQPLCGHKQTAATLGPKPKPLWGPKPKPLWGPNQSHQNKSNVLVFLCWPLDARRATSTSHEGSSHSINHVDPGWKKVFWLVRWIFNRWQSGGSSLGGSLGLCLLLWFSVCIHLPRPQFLSYRLEILNLGHIREN